MRFYSPTRFPVVPMPPDEARARPIGRTGSPDDSVGRDASESTPSIPIQRRQSAGVQPVDYVEHFRERVLQDALSEATTAYWERRAEAFAAARPRFGDFRGRATLGDLMARDRRLAATTEACRRRAAVAPYGEPVPDV